MFQILSKYLTIGARNQGSIVERWNHARQEIAQIPEEQGWADLGRLNYGCQCTTAQTLEWSNKSDQW